MLRKLLAWSVLAFMTGAVGCAMCASPYDECGPVLSDSCAGRGCSDARAGSILSAPTFPEEAEGTVVVGGSVATSPSPSDALPAAPSKLADKAPRAQPGGVGQGWKPSGSRAGLPPRPAPSP